MPSMPGTAISKSGVWAATRTRQLPSTSCGDRSRRRSTNLNVTCDARIAHSFKGDRTSAATSLRCERARSRLTIRHRRGGRASDNVTDLSTSPKQVYLAGPSFLDSIQLSECWGQPMLENEFKKQRAQVLLELVEKTNDPFIKRRLLALMSRYDDSGTTRTTLTPTDLKVQSQGTESER